MTTNVPGKENVKLPVALNITGEAKPEFPKELTINAPADLNYIPQPYEFTISNKGDKAFTITGIQSNLMEMDMETYMTEGALMVYAKSQNGGGEVAPVRLQHPTKTCNGYSTLTHCPLPLVANP